jgi:hypothetical protein
MALMGKASHLALSDLFAAHPEMSDMRRSPLPEHLDPFYDELMHMPYVQGLFAFGSLRQALERKLDQYDRRVPEEDYDGSDLYGRWNVSRSIDPPWMEA